MESQHDKPVIRVEDYSPVVGFLLWWLLGGAMRWLVWTQVPWDRGAQPVWLVVIVLFTLWNVLTERGLVVEIDPVRQKVVRHRKGLWGTKYDDEVREIPFQEIKEVEVKMVWRWWRRVASNDYRVRLHLENGDAVEITKPVLSLEATSKKAAWIANSIGLEQPPRHVD